MREFITTWKTDNDGRSNDRQISIDTSIDTKGQGYDFIVDWGDKQVDIHVSESITHTYSKAGVYMVKISGAFPRLYFPRNNDSDSNKLLSVEQWGDIKWESMASAFYGCIYLVVNAKDAPDLSRVKDMSWMFGYAHSFNQDIGHWDVSSVTNMMAMFRSAVSFNQDIGHWDVSSVTDMGGMFFGAHSFNQDITCWDVSFVMDMSGIFHGAHAFNQDVKHWDVSSVVRMKRISHDAYAFNRDVGNWDIFTKAFFAFFTKVLPAFFTKNKTTDDIKREVENRMRREE